MNDGLLPFLKDLCAMNIGLPRIFRLIIMLNARCPLKCKICGVSNDGGDEAPSVSELETFFSKNNFTWINLTGGEIFLRDDLVDIFRVVASTQDKLAYINFPTSGFLTEKTLDYVAKALETSLPKIYVTVSFDGGKESHEKLRTASGSFERAEKTFNGLKNLSAKSKNRLVVIPGMTLSAPLLELTSTPLEDLARDLRLDGIKDIHINIAHRSSHYYKNMDLKETPVDEVITILTKLAGVKKTGAMFLDMMEKIYLKGGRRYLMTGKTPISCKAMKASLFVDNKWTAYPCTLFSKSLGNLKTFDFDIDKLKKSPSFEATLKEVSKGNCPHCWTPCEAYPAIIGNLLNPSLYGILFD